MRRRSRTWVLSSRLVVPVLVVAFALPASAQVGSREMRLHVIDQGQGDAILLEFPCAAALIDAGGEDNAEFDGAGELMAYLDGFFKRRPDLKNRLDLLVLTHPHIDHTRGAVPVIAAYKPRNIVINGQTTGTGRLGQRAARDYAAAAEATPTKADDVGFRVVTVQGLPSGGGLTDAVIDPIQCKDVDPKLLALWGAEASNPGWKDTEFKNANNHSIVLRLDFGSASFLFTGDLEEAAIELLLERNQNTRLLDVDVFKVGHHGSSNATTDALLKAATPRMALLSMGPEARQTDWTAWAYGHPRETVVKLLLDNVSESRPEVEKSVATGMKEFKPVKVSKAVYGTGWDGGIIVRATTDGRIDVGVGGAPVPAADLLDINTATAKELEGLPGIGAKRAGAIVSHRSANGPFTSVDGLQQVRGIGPATFSVIRDLVVVRP